MSGIVITLLAQHLNLLIYLPIYLLVVKNGLLVQHVQWTEDRIQAVIATQSLFYHI
jgi:hypothetical protein